MGEGPKGKDPKTKDQILFFLKLLKPAPQIEDQPRK
jgi:hypothetical protein